MYTVIYDSIYIHTVKRIIKGCYKVANLSYYSLKLTWLKILTFYKILYET